MEAYALEWLTLLVRWLHLVAAIAWIGTSFYFIALDYALVSPRDARDLARGVGGEAWEIHGGGFYRVEKFTLAPAELPERLHWFKWEAYTTWLSGFGLLVLLYYLRADAYLIDRQVADLAPWQAVAISLGLLLGGWLVYDWLCRRLGHRPWVLAGLLALLVVAVAWGSSHWFSGRAVYLQVGAMLGTWMAANVFFVIIPGQREMVAAKLAGREPDPRYGWAGKQRSVHNNYLTLPVLFAMMSNHFPLTYSHPHGWLVLVALMGIAAWFRHFFNLRHQGRTVWAIPASSAAALTLLALWMAPLDRLRPPMASTAPAVEFTTVQRIVQQRCVTCHSAQPSYPGFPAAPKGVVFDTPEQIRAQAAAIYQQAVQTQVMPLGNLTQMTPAERAQLADWYTHGAPGP